MTKLTDTQAILLSTAAQRDSGSLFPPSTKIKPAGAAKAISSLIAAALVEERETSVSAETYRSNGDLRFGVYITPAGLAAIGVDDGESVDDSDGDESLPPAPAPTQPARASKSAAVIALLQRNNGATLAELVEATGWLPHTTRAALTGLRKKGYAIERGKRDDATCYSIKAAA